MAQSNIYFIYVSFRHGLLNDRQGLFILIFFSSEYGAEDAFDVFSLCWYDKAI